MSFFFWLLPKNILTSKSHRGSAYRKYALTKQMLMLLKMHGLRELPPPFSTFICYIRLP